MDKDSLYTLRWFIDKKWGDINYQQEANKLVSMAIGDWQEEEAEEEGRPSVSEVNSKSLWCPFAELDFPKSTTRGEYPKKYPEGAIVHFTAGRRNGLKNCLTYQANKGYTYFAIDKDGNIGQNFPLNQWGYHAGKSYWKDLGNSVSRRLVGIEVQCAGNLDDNNTSWFGVQYPENDVRSLNNKLDNIQPGKYLKYTDKQEESLVRLLLWLKRNNTEVFSFDHVLGHDEVSPKRKVDPGASLSMSMPQFRSFLKEKYKSI